MSDPDAEDVGAYCREIERYLCRVNNGHLVRIAGPSFQVVNGWHRQGIPFKVVCRGIDRRVGRQQERGGSRRPLRVEFCEADVLDVFAEWKRAVGRVAGLVGEDAPETAEATVSRSRGPSLPAHLERAQLRLTSVLAGSRMPPALTETIADIARRLDGWRADAAGLRGERRQQVLAQLQDCDRQLMTAAWAAQDAAAVASLRTEAAEDLLAFRGRMTPDAWEQTIDAAATRLLRERLSLPTLTVEL